MNAQIVTLVMRTAVVLVAAWGALAADRGAAEIIGNWDFSGGSFAGNAGSAVRLRELKNTSIYSTFRADYDRIRSIYPAYLSTLTEAPAMQFGTTDSFGITRLGENDRGVLRVPDARGAGAATGLVADFLPTTPGKTNRYTVVMDVFIPEPLLNFNLVGSPYYISLFQPRANQDGLLFVDKRRDLQTGFYPLGVDKGYGTLFQSDQWQRIAMVVDLEAAVGQPQYSIYRNGGMVASIAPPWSNRTSNPDGPLSLGALTDSNPPTSQGFTANLFNGLDGASNTTFFLFNDDTNEVGSLYVANLQFRDSALSAADILSLGGPTAAAIAVPEPTTIVGLVSAAVVSAFGSATRARRGRTAGGMLRGERSGSVAGRPLLTT